MRDFNKNRAYFFYFVSWFSLSCLEILYDIHEYFDIQNLKTLSGIHVTPKSKNSNLRYSAPALGRIHETRKSNKLKPEVFGSSPRTQPGAEPSGFNLFDFRVS